jgi:hypothetical protein
VLSEDTAALRERSAGGSYWVRYNEAYISLVTAHGFRLRDVTRSNVWASETAWMGIRHVMSSAGSAMRARPCQDSSTALSARY